MKNQVIQSDKLKVIDKTNIKKRRFKYAIPGQSLIAECLKEFDKKGNKK